jgi:hypothetical protein
VRAIDAGVEKIGGSTSQWANTEVESHSHITAVPEAQRSRRPGVPGEHIHFERGRMCVVENVPKYTYTLTAAAALQLLDGDLVRIHMAVAIERWLPGGNERSELWRTATEATFIEAGTTLAGALGQLLDETHAAQTAFDSMRDMDSPRD